MTRIKVYLVHICIFIFAIPCLIVNSVLYTDINDKEQSKLSALEIFTTAYHVIFYTSSIVIITLAICYFYKKYRMRKIASVLILIMIVLDTIATLLFLIVLLGIAKLDSKGQIATGLYIIWLISWFLRYFVCPVIYVIHLIRNTVANADIDEHIREANATDTGLSNIAHSDDDTAKTGNRGTHMSKADKSEVPDTEDSHESFTPCVDETMDSAIYDAYNIRAENLMADKTNNTSVDEANLDDTTYGGTLDEHEPNDTSVVDSFEDICSSPAVATISLSSEESTDSENDNTDSENHLKVTDSNGKLLTRHLKDTDPTWHFVGDLVQLTWMYNTQRGRDAKHLSHRYIQIKDVYLISNATLWDRYLVNSNENCSEIPKKYHEQVVSLAAINHYKKNDLNFGKVSEPKSHEAYLFHGTKLENIESVVKNGFDMEKANEGMFGRGIYLSDSSQKADQYADPRHQRRTENLAMFVVRARLDRIAMYDETNEENKKQYDCLLAGQSKRFREFVFANVNVLYPEFVVIYDRM